jgi:dihydroneopterin aldolase/2-amino-4-hydroxy-6-hydroxymethyldihydropteridine diphosphokinase/dihydropteroate synthase
VSLESLASLVARITLRHANQPDDIVTVRAAKPKALVFADAAEVEIVRTSQDYPTLTKLGKSALGLSPSLGLDPPFRPSSLHFLTQDSVSPRLGQHLAAIGLGSNLGDRFANIEAALRLLDQPELILAPKEQGISTSLVVVNTSFLYETAPMYVTDHPSFLNCACIVRSFQPDLLLALSLGPPD